MVREVQIHDGKVEVVIALTIPNCPMKDKIHADVVSAVSNLNDVKDVEVHMTAMTDEERKAIFGESQEGSATGYNHVKRVIAVMSGKGGVGKSLVTGLLATVLVQAGYKVGILDADITGPSIPKIFGLHQVVSTGPVGILPLRSRTGVKIMSFNLLLEKEDQPVIWRGPLIGRAITQLWGDVMWGELDYLLVDLPPGTADASLTTLQSLPVNGIVMVTMPQSLAAMIVRKAVHMAQQVGVPIVGVVENMSYFICPDTGNRHEIFGPSHVYEVADLASAPVFARLPIESEITELCDSGRVEDVDFDEVSNLRNSFLKEVPVHIGQPA